MTEARKQSMKEGSEDKKPAGEFAGYASRR